MLFLFAVLATVSAAVLLIYYIVRQDNNPVKDDSEIEWDPPEMWSLRRLFEPTTDEMRAFKRAEDERSHIESQAEHARLVSTRAALIGKQHALWNIRPTTGETVELLRLASESGDPIVFSEIAIEIVRSFRDGRLTGLAANDLAALLDSHYRLLPPGASGTGELFRLKQEIAALRSDV